METPTAKILPPDYFFILRPIIIVPVWAFSIFGYHRASVLLDTGYKFGFWRFAPIEPLFSLLLIFYGLLFGAIYILNQLADYETDKLKPAVWLLASDRFPRKIARIEMVIVAALAFGGCFIHPFAPWIFGFTAIIGVIYSLPPVRLSSRPFWDVLADSSIYGSAAFLLGWSAAGADFSGNALLQSTPYFFLMSAGALNQAIPDMDGDRATAKITTAVKLGAKNTAFLAVISLLLTILLSLLIRDWICLILAVFSFFFFFKAWRAQKIEDILRSYHIPGPLIILAAAVMFPPLLPVIIALYLLSRWYYPWRFGVDYPKVGK